MIDATCSEERRMAALPETEKKSWTYEAVVEAGLDPDDYEIVDGELVERQPMSLAGSRVFTLVVTALGSYEQAHHEIGAFFVTPRCRLRDEPRTERRPDVAFLRRERVPAPLGATVTGGPDIAIEVLSPTDRAEEPSLKARQYFDRGTQEVWIVDPHVETVTFLRPGRPARPFGRGDRLATPLLPGFELDLEALFGGVAR